ncbi:uncharacterized protein K02A2.6-like, partial [Daktulosphaira vitifoliae]|uniref:uncharacterized protein K02A2.6-like n=1 Tax=Daktulosphaira vitifoliae TaxID=58002 RepID=UPI0021AA0907
MFIADALSRDYLHNDIGNKNVIEDVYHNIHDIKTVCPISTETLNRLTEAIDGDHEYRMIVECVNNNWPNSNSIQGEMSSFYKIRQNLTVVNRVLFFNNKIVIPRAMRAYVLNVLHEGHFGINKCKSRARELIYWPKINNDIEKIVNNCELCDTFKSNNSKLPMLSHDIPCRPWQKRGTDILEYKSKSYLVVTDYFSKWFELRKIKDKSAKQVIETFINIFSIHGCPDEIVSDNIPFNSQEFKHFCTEWNIKSIYSSPHYPKSNGQAEKTVSTCKKILKKSEEKKSNLDIFLLNYRNTPIEDLGLSPAQLLMSRRLKDKLP